MSADIGCFFMTVTWLLKSSLVNSKNFSGKAFLYIGKVMMTGCGYILELCTIIFCRPLDRSHRVSSWSYRDSCWYLVEDFWPGAGMKYSAKDPLWIWTLRSLPVPLLHMQNNCHWSGSWDVSLLTHAVSPSNSKWHQSFRLYKPGLWRLSNFF